MAQTIGGLFGVCIDGTSSWGLRRLGKERRLKMASRLPSFPPFLPFFGVWGNREEGRTRGPDVSQPAFHILPRHFSVRSSRCQSAKSGGGTAVAYVHQLLLFHLIPRPWSFFFLLLFCCYFSVVSFLARNHGGWSRRKRKKRMGTKNANKMVSIYLF